MSREFASTVADDKNELAEAQNADEKWNAVKEIWLKTQIKSVGGQKDHQGIVKLVGGMKR